jgi:mono/diheme cytochrome c family protein
MSTPKALLAAAALAFTASAALADSPKLGKPITEHDIAPWDVTVFPDGKGLPAGQGNAVDGAKVYAQKCSACHGDNGKGGAGYAPALFAFNKLTDGIDAPKSIGNFFGYSTIVFDFVRRAMPFNMPRTLSNDEVYALTAYLLYINKVIGESDVMDAKTLPAVKMPNRDNFIIRFPERI